MADLEHGKATHANQAAEIPHPTWSSQPSVAAPLHYVGSPALSATSAGESRVDGARANSPELAHKDDIDGEKEHASHETHDQTTEKPEEVKRKVEDLEKSGYVLVGFEQGDPENPRNWPAATKWFLVCFCSYLNVCVASQASAYATGADGISEEFGVSDEVTTLGESLYILGFAIGPPIVAPLSEQFGRKPIYLICWTLWVLMAFPIAFSPSIEGVIICRFLAGLFASPPLSNTGGVISDLFARDFSGPAMAVYTFGSCIGPAFGNTYASFIAQKLSWRWIYYLTALLIFGLHIPLIYFFLPETRHNIILERKAARLRKEAASDRFVSVHATEKKSLTASLKIALTRPIRFLFSEPITMFAALWNGYLYSLVFGFNTAFAEIWGTGNGGYGWKSAGLVQLTFLSLIIGSVIALVLYPFTQERFYQRRIATVGESVPEARMFGGCFGCCLLPVGLFLTAFTSYPGSVPWIVPLLGPAIFGLGFFFVLFGILTYLTDSYGGYSASALGAAILIRNILGAIFPLFTGYMFKNLGNHWATALLAFLSLPLISITWFFYARGKKLRHASPFAVALFSDEEDAPH